jgi:signal transduction histidine kinase
MAATTRLLGGVFGAAGRRQRSDDQAASLAVVRRRRAVATAVAGILAGAAGEGGLWAHHPLLTVVNLLASITFTATGVLLMEDKAQRGTAWALIAGGITLPLGWLDQWEVGPFPLYSVVFGYLSDILGAWALLRYPEPRLSPGHRRFLVILAGWLIGGSLVLATMSVPRWWGGPFRDSAWWPSLFSDRPVFQLAQIVFDAGALILAICFVAALASRFRAASRRGRVILLPIITAGIIAAAAAAAVEAVNALSSHPASDELLAIEGVAVLTVPVGVAVSIIQQRLVRMTDLVDQLGRDSPTAEILCQVLRVSLRDSLLDLVIWSAADRAYRTVQGDLADLTALATGRSVYPVTAWNQQALALVVADPAVARDRGLMLTAAALIRITLDNVQLSRRLLTADYESRQKLAADLHNGVQSKLSGLLVTLSTARQPAQASSGASLDKITANVNEVLEELRDLVHGVYPDTLSRLGLRAAIGDAAYRLDLPADIEVPADPLSGEAARNLYFMICEALTNVYRHAHASHVTVAITRHGRMVEAVVTDNGAGGASPLGSGLSRMRDQAHAQGGGLEIDSPPGHGTKLTMRIPCA